MKGDVKSMVRNVKAKRIEIYDNSSNKYSLSKIRQLTGCDYIMNGGIFTFGSLKPLCHLKVDGKVIAKDQYKYWGYAFNNGDNTLTMTNDYSTYDNYICCSVMIRNGKKEKMIYNSDMGGKRGRTAIGTKKDGSLVLFCSKDGTSDAKTPENLQTYMLNQGCVDAIMLDGGGSSQCNFNGSVISSTRIVSNLILVWSDRTFIPSGTEISSTIKSGTKGSGAKWAQSIIQRIGYRIAVDGSFGSASVSALKHFQTYWGLEVDGKCGPASKKALKDCVNAIESSSSKALRVATKELGECESRGEDDKYISWYNAATGSKFAMNVSWCAIFVSWALRRGGYSEKTYPNFASCSAGLTTFKKNGVLKSKSYKPKAGDLIFFDFNQKGSPTHVGMVFACDGKYVETIEGNSSDAVRHKKYLLSNKYILNYVEVK